MEKDDEKDSGFVGKWGGTPNRKRRRTSDTSVSPN